MLQHQNIAIVGAGSWATAIAKILLSKAPRIHWWVREKEIKEGIRQKGQNPMYLRDVTFDPERIRISNDLKKVIADVDIIILVVPAVFLQDTLSVLTPEDFKGKKVCSAIKGIVPQTNQVVGDFLHDVYQIPLDHLSIISGPSHAEEIAMEKLTYLTSASENTVLAQELADLFICDYVKTKVSDDFFGIEYGAVLKNIYAIALGIAKGLGYGDNFRAVMVSNALQEMQSFVDAVYPKHRSLSISAYLGDLLVTAYSPFSRNRTFGNMIGEGYSILSAQLEMQMIAEGYYATKCIYEINQKYHIEMPMMSMVYHILYDHQSPSGEFHRLTSLLS